MAEIASKKYMVFVDFYRDLMSDQDAFEASKKMVLSRLDEQAAADGLGPRVMGSAIVVPSPRSIDEQIPDGAPIRHCATARYWERPLTDEETQALLKEAAKQLAQHRSEAKSAASRAKGKKGGRPRKIKRPEPL